MDETKGFGQISYSKYFKTVLKLLFWLNFYKYLLIISKLTIMLIFTAYKIFNVWNLRNGKFLKYCLQNKTQIIIKNFVKIILLKTF